MTKPSSPSIKEELAKLMSGKIPAYDDWVSIEDIELKSMNEFNKRPSYEE